MFGDSFPEIPETENLLDHWRDIGFARPMAMGGFTGIDWQEVSAFMQATQCNINPAEAQALVDMSRAYVSNIADTTPLSIAPMERKHD